MTTHKSPARAKAEAEVTIHNALTRLGAARRERLSDEDYDVYADGLKQFPAAMVAEVCEQMARKEPEEFGPRYPTLGAIRQACSETLRRRQIQREQNTKRLTMGDPVSPEKHAEIMAKFRAVLQGKGMR
jgi:hypothetical protein